MMTVNENDFSRRDKELRKEEQLTSLAKNVAVLTKVAEQLVPQSKSNSGYISKHLQGKFNQAGSFIEALDKDEQPTIVQMHYEQLKALNEISKSIDRLNTNVEWILSVLADSFFQQKD